EYTGPTIDQCIFDHFIWANRDYLPITISSVFDWYRPVHHDFTAFTVVRAVTRLCICGGFITPHTSHSPRISTAAKFAALELVCAMAARMKMNRNSPPKISSCECVVVSSCLLSMRFQNDFNCPLVMPLAMIRPMP